MHLNGTELCDEIKNAQGQATIDICLKYLYAQAQPQGTPQSGAESFYERRRAKDSELDLSKPLADQINLLRVCDNKSYPAFFMYKNQKYTVKIEKDND
jgi:methionyl-tRNA formyltransferase